MKIRSIFRVLLVVGGVVVISACATGATGAKPTLRELLAKLPSLEEITNADNADRALLIVQEIRIARRDHLAARIKADGVISAEEIEAAQKFDGTDSVVTANWSRAQKAVEVWRTHGGAMPSDFAGAFSLISDILLTGVNP